MATFSVDPSCLSALLKSDQDMTNAISRELARGRSKIPAYRPDDPPWPISTNDHTADIAK